MIKRIFITGLAAIIPLAITIYVIGGLFYFADSILGKYINESLYQYVGYTIPGLGIVIAILIVFLLGIIIHISRMRFFRWIEGLFLRIPLVNKVYSPVKKVVDFLFFPPTKSFKRAVLVQYPREGIYSLGFLTNESSMAFKDKGDKKLHNVFMPSSPYPLTGFTVIVEEKDIIFLDMDVDKAIKFTISGGLLNP